METKVVSISDTCDIGSIAEVAGYALLNQHGVSGVKLIALRIDLR